MMFALTRPRPNRADRHGPAKSRRTEKTDFEINMRAVSGFPSLLQEFALNRNPAVPQVLELHGSAQLRLTDVCEVVTIWRGFESEECLAPGDRRAEGLRFRDS